MMSISENDGKKILSHFCSIFKSTYNVKYKLRKSEEELFGKKLSSEKGKIYGGYLPASQIALFPMNNFDSTESFEVTVKHEILGHFGINTFQPDEKLKILSAIADSRYWLNTPRLWNNVEKLYSGSVLQKAEEIYALRSERIKIDNSPDLDLKKCHDSLQAALSHNRVLTLSDIDNIVFLTAYRMQDRKTKTQNFPATNSAQFGSEVCEAINTATSAYKKHKENLTTLNWHNENPVYQDQLIAVRMRGTGHKEEYIMAGILEGSSVVKHGHASRCSVGAFSEKGDQILQSEQAKSLLPGWKDIEAQTEPTAPNNSPTMRMR